jgi:hypothetical protein
MPPECKNWTLSDRLLGQEIDPSVSEIFRWDWIFMEARLKQ